MHFPILTKETAIALAEEYIKERGGNLKAKAAVFLPSGSPGNSGERSEWSVYFEIDDPQLAATSLDHVILSVRDDTREVWQFYPFNVVADDEDDGE
jgi:hypothetical protein